MTTPRPYHLIKSAQISGFVGFLFLFAGYAILTGDSTAGRIRARLVDAQNASAFHIIGLLLVFFALLLFGFAVFSQVRFGPPMSAIGVRAPLWPPRDFRAWLGIVAFFIGLLVMLAIIVVHVAFTLTST